MIPRQGRNSVNDTIDINLIVTNLWALSVAVVGSVIFLICFIEIIINLI